MGSVCRVCGRCTSETPGSPRETLGHTFRLIMVEVYRGSGSGVLDTIRYKVLFPLNSKQDQTKSTTLFYGI